MKKLLFILLAIMLPLAFSSCNETEENPTSNEITLVEIKCLDIEMNDIENVYYTINQSDYMFKGLYVYAFYSDGSTGDVTAFTSFDKTSFEQVGEYKVNANYKGFSDSFTVIVDEITVKRIECDINNL